MEKPSGSDLGVLVEGAAKLARRPLPALAMIAIGIALGTVGPLLQRWTGRADDAALLLLGAVGMLPWEFYFLPRFLARVDAEDCNHPSNPAGEWRQRFESRWLRTVLAKLALNLAVGFGLLLLLAPGLLVLFAFGWAPIRVLLRGEALGDAMKSSLQLMRLAWRRAVFMVGAAFLAAFAVLAALVAAAAVVHPGPGAPPLHSPVRWILEACSVSTSLWLSLTLLCAYLRLESSSESGSGK